LIKTGGVGSEVFKEAFKEATGRELLNVPDPTGKLEPALFSAACAENNIAVGSDLFAAFAEAQERAYRRHAVELTRRGGILPGVPEILATLASTSDVVQTVLSGNTLRSGRAKLEIFGLADWIDATCAVGGEDADTRPDLVRVAWDRAYAMHGLTLRPTETVVIGDTPADVDAALMNSCRIVAVATGRTSTEELARAGARLVLPDLADQQRALSAILAADDNK
jgi:phosphoglycolate phosphatase-like HAD superfamily hydrolase